MNVYHNFSMFLTSTKLLTMLVVSLTRIKWLITSVMGHGQEKEVKC